MTIHKEPVLSGAMQIPRQRAAETASTHGAVMTPTTAKMVAVLRISTAFIFLWAFPDKTFGFGYATPSENAWINGGSPTKGFLSRAAVGPFESTFHNWAGDAWADWLFMLGLLGIGVALLAGIGLRIAAAGTTLMMLLVWAAEWPPANTTSAGEPSMSTNPLVEYHVVYAIVAIVLAVAYAGNTWGIGKVWVRLPFVQRNRWLL
jgi:thiosulfate dehydrogenase [quinone] large subunit